MLRVIVAGGREFNQKTRLFKYLDQYHEKTPITSVVCGMARGADSIGKEWAESRGVAVNKFPADWDNLGKKAGPLRNIDMANNADALIAVWDGKSSGTKHMINTARGKGLLVTVLNY